MINITKNHISGQNRPGRKLVKVKGVVIHWTASTGRGANATAIRNYFNRTRDRYASAHYNVDDVSIIECIPDDELAYHVGAKWHRFTDLAKNVIMEGKERVNNRQNTPNNYLIGIELCVNADADLKITRRKGAELAYHLLEKHNLNTSHLYTHYDITGKECPRQIIQCPSPKYDNGEDWEKFIREVSEFAPIPDTFDELPGMLLGSTMGPMSALRCRARLIKPVSMFGRTDGVAEVRVSGGKPPYQIFWANGERGERAVRLGGGLHRVTVQDATRNTVADELFILEPFPGLVDAPVAANFVGGLTASYGLGDGNQLFPLLPA